MSAQRQQLKIASPVPDFFTQTSLLVLGVFFLGVVVFGGQQLYRQVSASFATGGQSQAPVRPTPAAALISDREQPPLISPPPLAGASLATTAAAAHP